MTMVSAADTHDLPMRQSARTKGGFTLGDVFVYAAISIVALAFGVGLIQQFGMTEPVAMGGAAFTFVVMLAGHNALRRAEAGVGLETSHHEPGPLAEPAPASRASERLAGLLKPSASERRGKSATEESQAEAMESSDIGRVDMGRVEMGLADMGLADNLALSGAERTGAATARLAAAPDYAALQDLDLGKFRPRAPADFAKGMATPAPQASGDIDAMIKRLANDIETGRKALMSAPKRSTMPDADNRRPGPVPAPPPLPAIQPAPPMASHRAKPPTMVEAARELAPSKRPPTLQPPSASARLAAIADALSDEQMDVFLETINGLEDYRAQHYEVSVRLRVAADDVLENEAYISETRGTGLLPLLEAVKVSSTKRLAVQMIRRGRTGAFFSVIDGEALSDSQFGEDVDTIAGGDPTLASRLVLAFTQADVRSLTPAQRLTLDGIAALGFRFSVEAITDLDMDFEDLAARGFGFAKLDADVFMQGLPIGTAMVPATDICRHLEKSGMQLIVGKIADEEVRARLVGFGASLGQGKLFGAPRPVRADVLRPSEQRPPAM
ncbi:MAG: EAL domain-containing protein [Alphaproteobacteria bacterium]|nr:EAL domain-containing protein [Alphaproteobacteria bacterium]